MNKLVVPIILGLVFIAVSLAWKLLMPTCTVNYSCENHVVLSKPYRDTLINLAKHDAFSKSVAAQNGRVITKYSGESNLDILKLRSPDWRWTAINTYIVETKNESGTEILELTQNIKASQNEIIVDVTLNRPTKHIKSMNNTVMIFPVENGTSFNLYSSITYQHNAPAGYHRQIHEEVQKSLDENIRKSMDVLLEVAQQNIIVKIPFK